MMDGGLLLLAGFWVFKGLVEHLDQEREEKWRREAQANREAERKQAVTIDGRAATCGRFSDARALFTEEYVSFTRLDMFAKCPQKFKLVYLDGNRHQDRDKGAAAHAGVQFHEVCDRLFTLYKNRYVGLALQDPIADAEPRLLQLLEAVPAESRIMASELELRYRLADREFLGYVDLALELPDSTVALVDFKTGYRNTRFEPDPIQLDIYSIPELLVRPDRRVRLALILVDAQRTIVWVNGPDNGSDVMARVASRVSEIETRAEFSPRPSRLCDFCQVKRLCPAKAPRRTVRDDSATMNDLREGKGTAADLRRAGEEAARQRLRDMRDRGRQ